MNNYEVAELFYNQMMNEIFHSPADENLQEILITSLKEVNTLVLETIQANNKPNK